MRGREEISPDSSRVLCVSSPSHWRWDRGCWWVVSGVQSPGDIPWWLWGTGLCPAVLPLSPAYLQGKLFPFAPHAHCPMHGSFLQRSEAPGARGGRYYLPRYWSENWGTDKFSDFPNFMLLLLRESECFLKSKVHFLIQCLMVTCYLQFLYSIGPVLHVVHPWASLTPSSLYLPSPPLCCPSPFPHLLVTTSLSSVSIGLLPF